MPLVSIIMRTKDRPVLLPRAVKSVVSQTLADWQLIIVNDGGAPEGVDQVAHDARRAGRGRIDIVHHKTSKGMEAASNAGLQVATGKYVVIHDDDDSWQNPFLEEMTAFLENRPRTSIRGAVCHSLKVSEVIGPKGCRVVDVGDYNSWLQSISLFRMAAENTFPPIAFLYERAVLDEIGGYAEDLPVLGDWDFNLRFLERWDIAVLPKPLSNYHIRVQTQNKNYGNTITDGVSKHVEYNAVVRNRYLRRDLEQGKLGLGLLVNLAHEMHVTKDAIEGVKGRSDLLINLTKVMTGLLESSHVRAA